MKYFTKEWFRSHNNDIRKIKEAQIKYDEYYQSIKHLIPKHIQDIFVYDSYLVDCYFEGKDYIMKFDSTYANNRVEYVIFKNAQIIENEISLKEKDKISWMQDEIYIVNSKYEMHVLFMGEHLRELIVQADDIRTIDGDFFLNMGVCSKCYKNVSDPDRDGFRDETFFAKGKFIDDEWYCNDCLPDDLKK